MAQICPYIWFNGNCKEAMTYYKECLGGELFLQTIGGSPVEEHLPPEAKDKILHSTLTKGEFLLQASDMAGHSGYNPGNNFGLSVNCSSEEEISTFYNNLAAGGEILDPLKTQFWGAIFGVLKDKFGMSWMFNYDQPKG
jgi:PhnB protein